MLSSVSGMGTYMWHQSTFTSTSGASLPWAINYLLAHHRKHVFRLSPPSFGRIQGKCNEWKQKLLWRDYFEQARIYDDTYGDNNREDTAVDMVPFRSRLPPRTCWEELPDLRYDVDEAIETIELAAAGVIRSYRKILNLFECFQFS